MVSKWVAGFVIGVCGWLLLADVAIAGPRAPRLRSLYIRQNAPTWGGEEYVAVEPVGDDVRIRVIDVELASEWCTELVVSATERILPHTTVQAVADVPVCSLSERAVERAYARAEDRGPYYEFVSGAYVVVADCGGTERMFVHYSPPLIDTEKLRRISSTIFALRKMGRRLTGDGPLTNTALGTSLAPLLLSGTYAELVPDYLAKGLKTYQGPPAFRGGFVVELIERETLPLTRYVGPVYPQIAQSARVSGDVRLRLTLDSATGAVADIETLANKPLLTDAAIQAARQWVFDPAKAPREPVEVTLRFHVRCATEAGSRLP
jgi:TonB family protein